MLARRRTSVIAAFALGIAYRLLMGLQGFDTIDMGYCMTFYQNIFTHPDALLFQFNFYLTGVVGGVWELLLGGWGLQGSRLFEVLTEAAAIALMYAAFRPWMKTTAMAVVAVGASFLFPTIFISFHYDTLSFLLMAASLYAMMRWQRGGSLLWLGVAGLWLGVNVFARTVNGVLWALVLIPLLTGGRHSWKRGWTQAFTCTGGIAVGCLLVVALMLGLGHWGHFIDGMSQSIGLFAGSEDTHSSGGLLGAWTGSAVNVLLQMLCLAVVGACHYGVGRLTPRIGKVLRCLLMAVVLVLVYTSNPYLSAVASCTLLILMAAWPWARERLLTAVPPTDYLIVAGYAIGCAYLFPFGSDIGIQGIFNRCGGLLVVPAVCCWQWLKGGWMRQTAGAVCISVCVAMVVRTADRPYGERCPRWETTEVALPGTINVMTDHERALRYQHIVDCIAKHDGGNPLLLVGNQAAELYYATHKLPFSGNTLITAYNGKALARQLDRQHAHYGGLPVVAFLRYEADDPRTAQFRRDVQPWMEKHGYRQTFRDEYMELYTAE